MKDEPLLDDDLAAAFRSVRETYDGTNEESNATLQRALFRTRTRERRTRFTRWVVLPIAAVLAASTAWAGVTGKLTPVVGSVLESFHTERTAPPPQVATKASSTLPAAAPPAPAEENVADEVAPPVDPLPETSAPAPLAPPTAAAATASAPSAPSVPPATSVAARPSSNAPPVPVGDVPAPAGEPATVAAPSASASDPNAALFAEAHRLHFIDRDPARALVAWDRYLAAAPNGRFAPEARYNRALALVRLGRAAEAEKELAAFASGTYGSYRREEAKALLDALTRDASRP